MNYGKINNTCDSAVWADRSGNVGGAAAQELQRMSWRIWPLNGCKTAQISVVGVLAALWSMLGVFLSFSLLPSLISNRTAIIAAPLIFIFFGGADFIGTHITHYSLGPPNHFEWWSGWAQFSSNTTALFWSPHQALPAWLATVILMRCRQIDGLLPYCALLASATLLWSPLVAIGLTPFLLAVQRGPRGIVFGWRVIANAIACIASRAVSHCRLRNIPHGFIGTFACTRTPCFTWPSYFLLLAVEIGAPLAILFLRKESEQGFLIAAAVALCLIPLYKVGIYNDFVMRASLPALAVLAILLSKLFAGPKPYSIAALAILLLALPSVVGELSRGFRPGAEPLVINLATVDETFKWWVDQTFTSEAIWVLR